MVVMDAQPLRVQTPSTVNLSPLNHPQTATNQPLLGYGRTAKRTQNFILATREMTGILLATLSALRRKSSTKSSPFYHPTHSLHSRYLQRHGVGGVCKRLAMEAVKLTDGYLLSPRISVSMSIHKRQCCNTYVYSLSCTTGQKNRIIQNKVYL